jgi:hypothetical protein
MEGRMPLQTHIKDLHRLIKYLTKLNTVSRQEAKPSLTLTTSDGLDMSLRTLFCDIFPLLRVKSLEEYQEKYNSLSSYFTESARPSPPSTDNLVAEKSASLFRDRSNLGTQSPVMSRDLKDSVCQID